MKKLTKFEIASRITEVHRRNKNFWTTPTRVLADTYKREELVEICNRLIQENGYFDLELVE